ncbi:MAG: ATP-binding protein [Pseudohongiella sp.]|nr:ATP-binding protein [Pseudohongiella sp.]
MPSSKRQAVKWRLSSRAWLIAGVYALVSILWIYFSDLLLFALFPDPEIFGRVSVYKGFAFVVVTSLLLLMVLLRAFGAVEGAFSALQSSERRLSSSRGQLSAVINSAMDAIVTVDLTGRVRSFNSAAERMFGTDAKEVLGRPIGRLLPVGIDQFSAARFETVGIRNDGDSFPVEAAVSEVHSRQGVFYTAIFRDISERLSQETALRELNETLEKKVIDRTRELEVAAVRAQAADRLKSAFLATMSHELRTPLNSIIGFTGIVLQGLAGPLNEEQTKQLGMVRGSARHLLDLINDVLDLSKIEAGELQVKPEPFSIRESLDRVIASVQPQIDKKALQFSSEISADVTDMVGDRRRIEQIVLNLLSNAIKFTDQGSISLDAAVTDDQLVIRITDTGIGIRPGDLKGLFQPFNQIDTGLTREHDGTGLGLAICRRLTSLLGGQIDVSSEWQKGSTFSISLPLVFRG